MGFSPDAWMGLFAAFGAPMLLNAGAMLLFAGAVRQELKDHERRIVDLEKAERDELLREAKRKD